MLACIDETQAPFVSCYLDLEQGRAGYQEVFEDHAIAMRCILGHEACPDFDAGISQMRDYLAEELRPGAQGVALFSRHSRGEAFLLPMQFAAPLPNWIAVYPTPNLFHLMALKDNYHRYVVLLANQAWVRILEANLGAATI